MFTNTITSPTKIGKPVNYREYICDTANDIDNLPKTKKTATSNTTASVGSRATVVDTGEIYILGNDDEWIPYSSFSGGGGGSGSGSAVVDDADIATWEEIVDYLGLT